MGAWTPSTWATIHRLLGTLARSLVGSGVGTLRWDAGVLSRGLSRCAAMHDPQGLYSDTGDWGLTAREEERRW